MTRVHPRRVGRAAAHARPRAERARTRTGSPRRSGTCRWRSTRPGRCWRDTGLDVDTYLRLLRERADELLAHDGGGGYPVSVAASWAVAFDRLAADDPAALDLLTLVAWCGPEPVPLDLLTDHPDPLPDRLAADLSDPLALAGAPRLLHRRAWPPSTPHSCNCTGSRPRCCARARPTIRLGVGRRGSSVTICARPHGVENRRCGRVAATAAARPCRR